MSYSMKPLCLVFFTTMSFTKTSCSNPNEHEEVQTSAKTYYVSQNGNDDNSGTSVTSPWQSLKKLEEIDFQPGDSILFAKDSEFHGGISLNHSGAADKPIVFARCAILN